MILDANLLLYARNAGDPHHDGAKDLVERVLNGPVRVGMPWQSLTAFLRIGTHPRVFATPMSPAEAVQQVREWLGAPAAWIPTAGPRHADVFLAMVADLRLSGPVVSDAHLAALAVEHGTELWSTDSDFARFPGLAWSDPLR